MNKQKIFDNVAEYSAEQLAGYIQEGGITFDEIVQNTDGEFDAEKRKEVKYLLKNGDSDGWEKAKQARTVDAVQSYLDKFPDGQYREQARSLKENLTEEIEEDKLKSAADAEWTKVDKNNLNSLRSFIVSYPDSRFINEANRLINSILLDEIMEVNVETLVSQIRQIETQKFTIIQKDAEIISTIERFLNENKIEKADLLGKIKEDPNLLSAGVVKRLIDSGTITPNDLVGIGINKLFIQRMLNGESVQSLPTAKKIDRIHKLSTEIYFWGIPSSGKSSALGAILSVAGSGRIAKSIAPDVASQGYGYMTKLMNLFHDDEVGTLMGSTEVVDFYEMGFDLYDNGGRIHPITSIDMAGELMRCMYKANAGDEMNKIELSMLDTLTNVLIDNRSANRKMHFFVIEYGAEDRLYEGLPQKTYLDGVVSYIQNTGIFKKDTDAIYIMISKADKVKNATTDTFGKYINDKYLGFYNGLEQICKDNEINKGRVEKIAFSLGEVCFQNYCKFDSKAADNVVKIILERSASYKRGKLGKLQKTFRG